MLLHFAAVGFAVCPERFITHLPSSM